MPHQSLHASKGSKLGPQQGNKAQVLEIAKAYLAAIESGKMTVEHISEIDLGGGRFVRTFVISGDNGQ